MPASRREELVDSAAEVFYLNGFNATGIDKVLKNAGVAKMTLYHHFRSKDDLILAALRHRDERFRNWLVRTVEDTAHDPRRRLLAVFDALDQWISGPNFNGCMFINAAAEFGELADPIHASAAEHKRLVGNYLETLAAGAGAKEPRNLARQISLLVDGAIVTAHVSGDPSAVGVTNGVVVVVLILGKRFLHHGAQGREFSEGRVASGAGDGRIGVEVGDPRSDSAQCAARR